MQLNVLDDLAEAMKALDGKKDMILETELGLPCSRPLLPTRRWFDEFLYWNSAAEECAWVDLKTDLQGGTGFNLLRVQLDPRAKEIRKWTLKILVLHCGKFVI